MTKHIERRFNYYVEEVTSSEEAAAILTLVEVLLRLLPKAQIEEVEEAK